MKTLSLSLSFLLMAGCAAGPDYQAPEAEPVEFIAADAAGVETRPFEAEWWSIVCVCHSESIGPAAHETGRRSVSRCGVSKAHAAAPARGFPYRRTVRVGRAT